MLEVVVKDEELTLVDSRKDAVEVVSGVRKLLATTSKPRDMPRVKSVDLATISCLRSHDPSLDSFESFAKCYHLLRLTLVTR